MKANVSDKPVVTSQEVEALKNLLELSDKLRDNSTQKSFWRKFGESLVIGAGVSIISSLVVGLFLMLGTIFTTAWQDMGAELNAMRLESKADREAIKQTAEASYRAIGEISKIIPTMDQSESIGRIWKVLGPLSNDVANLKGQLAAGLTPMLPIEPEMLRTPELLRESVETLSAPPPAAPIEEPIPVQQALEALEQVQLRYEK